VNSDVADPVAARLSECAGAAGALKTTAASALTCRSLVAALAMAMLLSAGNVRLLR